MTNLKLNIGSGRFKIEGFRNIDINPIYMPDQCMDALAFLKTLPNLSVTDIYAGHVIQQFDYKYLHDFMVECKRVMTQDARLTITVPDIELAFHAYNQGKISPGQLDLVMLGSRVSMHDYHRTVWTKRRMMELGDANGFRIEDWPEQYEWLVVKVVWQRCAIYKKR